MKTRKLLVLLLALPLLAYCTKPDPDNGQEQEQGQGQDQGQGQEPTPEDPFADAAPEVKNGDLILVTNAKMQAFLEDVQYPERDYTETHILDEKYGPTAPGNADKPQEYSIRWTKADADGDKTVKLWEDDGWSREINVEGGEYYVNIINLRPGAHYHFEVKGAGGKTVTSGEFDTKGLVYQVLFKANVRNARDLGGWKTKDGKKMVKYRMIYRGGRLQGSTLTSKRGKEDLKAQGILAQLDLRGKSDVLSGPAVDYMDFCAPVIEEGYTQMLKDDGAKVKQCFEYVAKCVKENKPVYYHCSLGRDRTGTLSMLLLGVLGVNEGDISKEYELTQFAPYEWATSGGETTKMTRRADYKGAANYIWNNFVGEGESFAQGVEKYLLSIGVSQETITEFRTLMLV
jgi:hypothetical protein